jgi:hypothetical protein
MDDAIKGGYSAGVISLIMTLICGIVALHSNLSEMNGQVVAVFAGLFGLSTVGSFVYPATFGQYILELYNNIHRNMKEDTQPSEEINTTVIQNIGHVEGDVNQNIGSKRGVIKPKKRDD